MRVETAPPTQAALEHVAEHMSEADRREIWCASQSLPLDALQRSVLGSHDVSMALYDGEPVAVFGCAHFGDDGSPWLLGTERLRQHPRAVLQTGKRFVERYAQAHPRLVNFVHWQNAPSLRWLRRLGFTIHPARPWGSYGVAFHEVERCASPRP